MSMVDVQTITKKFGTFTAVDAISFVVEPGEVFGLLGPNGAGKSTLLRMLTTLLPPTSGTAVIAGADIVKQPDDVRRAIGVIPQAMTSDLELSARENLTIFAKLYGVPRQRRATLIADLLESVELTKWADSPVKQLSGGMRRRVAIARAIVNRPDLILYDSPTGGLDPITSTTIIELVMKQRDVYRTSSLLVTHRLQDAFTLATHNFDRAQNHMVPIPDGGLDPKTNFLVLHDGHIVFDGSTHDLVHSEDPFLKEYLS